MKIIIKESGRLTAKDLYTAEEVAQYYSKKLSSAGLDVDVKSQVGKGSKGVAFGLPNGKVLKITRDPTEANSSAVLVGKKTKHLPKIERVFHFGNTAFFGIVMEKLTPLSMDQEDFWNELNDSSVLFKAIKSFGKPPSWKELEPVIRKFAKGSDGFYNTPQKEEELISTAKQFNLPQMIDELHKFGIKFYDFHGGNIMKRGNTPVVIDLGYSEQQNKLKIPMLEKNK